MSKIRCLVILIGMLLSINTFELFAQTPDSVQQTSAPVKKDRRPRNATIRSAIIPGWGQAYNHKYWKVPIIYVGGGIITYFYITNAQTYREFRDKLKNASPNDQNINIYRINRDHFREYRDWNIAMFIGLYVLNIIDANVDAHLREFDVSDDLALTVKPYLYRDFYNSPVTGLTLNLRIKK